MVCRVYSYIWGINKSRLAVCWGRGNTVHWFASLCKHMCQSHVRQVCAKPRQERHDGETHWPGGGCVSTHKFAGFCTYTKETAAITFVCCMYQIVITAAAKEYSRAGSWLPKGKSEKDVPWFLPRRFVITQICPPLRALCFPLSLPRPPDNGID